MPLSDMYRTAPTVMQLVDAIPADCGSRLRKRRRPTVGTEETDRCSDDELSEVVVVAVGENHSVVDVIYEQQPQEYLQEQQPETPPCRTPPVSDEEDDVMDLSIEKLLRSHSVSTSSSHLMALLEENERSIQALLAAQEEEIYHTPQEAVKSTQSARSTSTWKDARQYELRESLPGVAAMLLYCVAHSATYELVSNLAYEAVEQEPDEDGGHSKLTLYTTMLIMGCVLARASGLVWNFSGPLAYQQVKLIYHNRIRLGAVDARWLYWLQQQGEHVLGVVHIIAYYLCYIAVVFFVEQLAVYCDQREGILDDLPSAVYEEELQEMMMEGEAVNYQCPALFGNGTAAAVWESLGCPNASDELEIFGPEDDMYFFQTLSRNSYDHFFGQDYETAFFSSTHQLLFYAALAATSIYTLKAGLGFSFWAGW